MPVQRRFSEQVTTTFDIAVSGKEIMSLIPELQPTDEVKVIFAVPTGGDYSGTELEINETNPVIVRVTRTRETLSRLRIKS